MSKAKKRSYSQRFNELILTFFYCGKSVIAPGTVGTIGATFLWIYLNNYFIEENLDATLRRGFWLLTIALFTLYAIQQIPHYYILKNQKNIDHKSIVIDEAVGIFIALEIFYFWGQEIYELYQGRFIIYVIFCFIIFRILDITKPSIIGMCDKKIKTPLGVMLDDILCGIISGITTMLLYNYTFNSSFFELVHC